MLRDVTDLVLSGFVVDLSCALTKSPPAAWIAA